MLGDLYLPTIPFDSFNYSEVPTANQQSSLRGTLLGGIKDALVLALGVIQVGVGFAAVFELASLFASFIFPILMTGAAITGLSLVSNSFKQFIVNAYDKISVVLLNNIRLIGLFLLVATPLRTMFGLNNVVGFTTLQQTQFAESIKSALFAFVAMVAGIWPKPFNKALASLGLVQSAKEDHDAPTFAIGSNQNVKARLLGALTVFGIVANSIPQMIIGISIPSITLGLGAALGEALSPLFQMAWIVPPPSLNSGTSVEYAEPILEAGQLHLKSCMYVSKCVLN